MRMTPQLQAAPSSVVDKEHDTTHISDSMPGTAAFEPDLQKRLARVEEMLHAERQERKAEEKHLRRTKKRKILFLNKLQKIPRIVCIMA